MPDLKVDERGTLILPPALLACGKGKGDLLPDGETHGNIPPCWFDKVKAHGHHKWAPKGVEGVRASLCPDCKAVLVQEDEAASAVPVTED